MSAPFPENGLGAFRTWIRIGGVYNLLSSAPVAVPFFLAPYYRMLNASNALLHLGGADAAVPTDAATRLMVSTAGLTLCLLGVLLLWSSGDLENRVGVPLGNAVARIFFSALVFYFVFESSLPRIFVGFAVTDLVFAAAYIAGWLRLRQSPPPGPSGLAPTPKLE